LLGVGHFTRAILCSVGHWALLWPERFRRSGIGRALTLRVEQWCADLGLPMSDPQRRAATLTLKVSMRPADSSTPGRRFKSLYATSGMIANVINQSLEPNAAAVSPCWISYEISRMLPRSLPPAVVAWVSLDAFGARPHEGDSTKQTLRVFSHTPSRSVPDGTFGSASPMTKFRNSAMATHLNINLVDWRAGGVGRPSKKTFFFPQPKLRGNHSLMLSSWPASRTQCMRGAEFFVFFVCLPALCGVGDRSSHSLALIRHWTHIISHSTRAGSRFLRTSRFLFFSATWICTRLADICLSISTHPFQMKEAPT